ncbi:MAG: hypothetical protein KKI14_01860, partial [Nanoarchaeota archaeon]|nr:hypothetical protein [Nanoarchaeota archaeon]
MNLAKKTFKKAVKGYQNILDEEEAKKKKQTPSMQPYPYPYPVQFQMQSAPKEEPKKTEGISLVDVAPKYTIPS